MNDWEPVRWERRCPLTADGENYVLLVIIKTESELDQYQWFMKSREGRTIASGAQTFLSQALRRAERSLYHEIGDSLEGAQKIIAKLRAATP